MEKLAPKHRLFVQEFLVDLNGTQAAIRAGYGRKSARTKAAKLRRIPAIKKAIEAAQKKLGDRLEITQEKWLREFASIFFAKMPDFMEIEEGGGIQIKPFETMPPEMIGAIESIEENRTIRESSDGKETNIVNDRIKFKLHSKIEAGKVIGQHLGYLKDPNRIEIPGVERALYELSEKFLPAMKNKKRSDGSK